VGAHLPLLGLEPVDGEPTNVCDAWLVRHQIYDYLPSCKASPPIGWYQIILLGDKRRICVNNLPKVALGSMAAVTPTRDLLIASPASDHYATEPHLLWLVDNHVNY